MSDKVKMGTLYWEINNKADSYDSLHEFFVRFGFREITPDSYRDEITGWARKRKYTDGHLVLTTEWFINLAILRFGDWEGSLCDITFTKIIGSFLPYADHNTFRVLHNGSYVCNLALAIQRAQEGAEG